MPSQFQHISRDALFAEELAIRYADSTRGLYSGHYSGPVEYDASRERCMAALFNRIAMNHQVTVADVRASLSRRPRGFDLLVFFSFAAFYSVLVYVLTGPMYRRWPLLEGSAQALIMVIFASFCFSAAGVMLGEVWAVLMETFRLGARHLSYRASRIPWAHHRSGLFAAGLAIFWLAALFRIRCSRLPVSEAAPGSHLLDLN